MSTESAYILILESFDDEGEVFTPLLSSKDKAMLYNQLELKAKKLAEEYGTLETNKGKEILCTAYFEVLDGEQKMYFWELKIGVKTCVTLSICKTEMI